MKYDYINLTAKFFRSILTIALFAIGLFIIAVLSCSCTVQRVTGNKTCIVTSKKCDRRYCAFKLETITTKQYVYLTGYKKDANLSDTVLVKYGYDNLPYILK